MFIPTLSEIKLAIIAAAVIGSFFGGVGLEAKIKKGELEHIKRAQVEANLAATNASIAEQKRLDRVALAAAQKEGASQAALASLRARQLAEVKKHVKDIRTHIPYGVVRLLDSYAGGVLADTLVLPAGKSDDALTDLGWTDLARNVGDNYAKCRSTFESRDALIDAFRASKK